MPTATARELSLREWSTAEAGPEFPQLLDLWLDDPELARALAAHPLKDRLRLTDGRRGLRVQTRQHVGAIQLGPLVLRILPKLEPTSLWTLVSYALGLDSLERRPPVGFALDGDFVELVAAMFHAECDRVWRSGLRRGYVSRSEWLAAPRGRPELSTLVHHLPLTRAQIPCRHQAFTADTPENQVLLAGLTLAARGVRNLRLRGELRRLAECFATVCTPIQLSRVVLDDVDRRRNRLSAHYAGAHRLVRLWFERSGLDDEHAPGATPLPGFLWNMATLFERLLERFLIDHLPDAQVEPQERMHDLYSVPRGSSQRVPPMRPDLVIYRDGCPVLVVDAKYRDLSSTSLPRHILYQLSVYALAWKSPDGSPVPAVALYPVERGTRPDREIHLRVAGAEQPRRVILRAIDLGRVAELLEAPNCEERVEFARQLVRTQPPRCESQQGGR